MKQFSPVNIHHLDLAAALAQPLPAAPALCYFWWNGIPLGHVWMEEPSTIATPTLIVEAVKPAVLYYLSVNTTQPRIDWEQYFHAEDSVGLATFLDSIVTPAKLPASATDKQPVSIVICTRNRAEMLEKCITALMDSNDQHFELVIIDNAPDDDSTKKVTARFSGIRYVCEPRKGLDIARNTGAREASHSIIAFTDDDVIVDPDWVGRIRNCFLNPMTMAVTGQVIPVELQTRSQYLFEKYWGFNKGYVPRIFDHRYFLDHQQHGVPVWDIGAGANMAFRREVFDAVGFFDERLDVGAAGCSGDSEYWYRILAEGWNCFYCPQLFVYHQHRNTDKALRRQVFNYMRGQVAALFVQYENYGHKGNLDRIFKVLPDYYLRRLAARLKNRTLGAPDTIATEIRGCISGWRYYQSVKNNYRTDPIRYDPSLYAPASVTDATLVSVIITSYNYGNYLPQAIESVLAQTYKNVEIIVVDDGSTDNTQEIIKRYPGVRSVLVHRVGAAAARNIGVQYSTGDFLVFLDADDYLFPEALAINCALFATHPLCAFISGGHQRVNAAGEPLPQEESRELLGNNYLELLRGNYIAMLGNVMYRRQLFFAFHFNPTLSNCEDYDLNLRIVRDFPTYSHTHKIIAYRIHNSNKSGSKKNMFTTIKKILNGHYLLAENDEVKKAAKEGLKNWRNYYSGNN